MWCFHTYLSLTFQMLVSAKHSKMAAREHLKSVASILFEKYATFIIAHRQIVVFETNSNNEKRAIKKAITLYVQINHFYLI